MENNLTKRQKNHKKYLKTSIYVRTNMSDAYFLSVTILSIAELMMEKTTVNNKALKKP